MSAPPLTTEPPSFTAIITGVSPSSPLSKAIINALISSLPETTALSLALLGPSDAHLDVGQSDLFTATDRSVNILADQCSITSGTDLGLASHTVRSNLGAWDLFIHNAPDHIPDSQQRNIAATIRGSDEDTWWNVFEQNVHSLHHIARHFFPKMKRGARFVNVLPTPVVAVASEDGGNSSSHWHMHMQEKKSAECAAAVAAGKVVEYLAVENRGSGMRCANVGVRWGDAGQDDERAKKAAGEIVRSALEADGKEDGRRVCEYLTI